MNKIGRNDPCPCGSGNKYKKCCLAKDNLNASRRREEQQAIHVALSWLEERLSSAAAAGGRLRRIVRTVILWRCKYLVSPFQAWRHQPCLVLQVFLPVLRLQRKHPT